MQIHELNNFGGSLGSGSYLAIDNGTDTGKISSTQLLAATEARIDNIIAGPAPSAQEVTDARLGATALGSVQYASLGDAIRGQATLLANDIEGVKSGSVPLESGSWTDNAPIVKVSNASKIRSTSKVYVNEIESITFPTGYSGYGVVFDASGTRLGYTSGWVNSITQYAIRSRYADSAHSFVFTVRNDSTPSGDISAQVNTVMSGTVTKWSNIRNKGSISLYYGETADIDAITEEGVWYGKTPNTFVNIPLGFAGSPFILEVFAESGVVIQKITDIEYDATAVRYAVSGEWNSWGSVPAYSVVGSSSAESKYNNLAENLPSNGFFYVSTDWFTDMASLGSKIGHLFTFAPKMFSATLCLQVFYPASQGNVSCRTRLADSSWTNWRSLAQSEGDYHDADAAYYAFGDSTTYGQIGGGSGQSPYNYPACTGQILNMVVHNHGVTNQGLIKDWDTIHTNFINNLDMTGAKLITVGWAYNDYAQYAGINFGAYDDTGDTTFIGKYYTIMKEFQQKCPDAKIILVTGYGYSNGTTSPVVKPTLVDQFTHKYTFADGQKSIKQMYDTLEEMCYAHGWSCVNQAKGTVFNEWNASLLIGDQIHPTSYGYLRYGNHLGARIAALYANVKEW